MEMNDVDNLFQELSFSFKHIRISLKSATWARRILPPRVA